MKNYRNNIIENKISTISITSFDINGDELVVEINGDPELQFTMEFKEKGFLSFEKEEVFYETNRVSTNDGSKILTDENEKSLNKLLSILCIDNNDIIEAKEQLAKQLENFIEFQINDYEKELLMTID